MHKRLSMGGFVFLSMLLPNLVQASGTIDSQISRLIKDNGLYRSANGQLHLVNPEQSHNHHFSFGGHGKIPRPELDTGKPIGMKNWLTSKHVLINLKETHTHERGTQK